MRWPVADEQPFIVSAAHTLRAAAKVRAVTRGADAAGALTARVTDYVDRVHPALELLAAVEAEMDALVPAPDLVDARRYADAARRHHHAIAAVIRAHRGEVGG